MSLRPRVLGGRGLEPRRRDRSAHDATAVENEEIEHGCAHELARAERSCDRLRPTRELLDPPGAEPGQHHDLVPPRPPGGEPDERAIDAGDGLHVLDRLLALVLLPPVVEYLRARDDGRAVG